MRVPRLLLIAVLLTAVAVVAHLFMHLDVTADAVAEPDGVVAHGQTSLSAAVQQPPVATAGAHHGSDESHELMAVLCMAVLGALWVASHMATHARAVTGSRPVQRWRAAPLRSSPLRRRGDRIDAGIVLLV